MTKQGRISNGIQSLQQKVLGKLDGDMQKMNLDHFLTPYTKINSKWMEDLNVRQKAIKIPVEKTGSNLFDLGHSNFLLDMYLEARKTKAKMNYFDLIKIKRFCTVKETISKTKRQPTEWQKIFVNDISDIKG